MNNPAAFALHARLEADTAPVCDLALCAVRLMNDMAYPWLILVPRRAGISEIMQLAQAERSALMEEINLAGQALQDLYAPGKINIGALGNLVPQLHVHVIARRSSDPAWPGPVWGHGPATPYEPRALDAASARLRDALLPGWR